jgi:hypothetical protein
MPAVLTALLLQRWLAIGEIIDESVLLPVHGEKMPAGR